MTTKRSKSVSMLLLQNRQVPATEFKARCLEIMDEVDRTGIEVTITKHRKPVARLVPVSSKAGAFCGSMRGRITFEGDIISPVDVQWDAEQDAGSP